MSYSNKVIDYYENPRNVGSLDKNDSNVGTGLVGAPACIHGDTLIAVADGRKFVSIKELADIGEDVPIYSYNNLIGIHISIGRMPRLISKKVDVVRVKLDDDSSFICTPDHLIRSRNRYYNLWIKAIDLNPMQEIMPFTRVLRRGYYHIHTNKLSNNLRLPEHRMIYQFNMGKITQGYQIHHKNHNKLDNSLNNLEALSYAVFRRLKNLAVFS